MSETYDNLADRIERHEVLSLVYRSWRGLGGQIQHIQSHAPGSCHHSQAGCGGVFIWECIVQYGEAERINCRISCISDLNIINMGGNSFVQIWNRNHFPSSTFVTKISFCYVHCNSWLPSCSYKKSVETKVVQNEICYKIVYIKVILLCVL